MIVVCNEDFTTNQHSISDFDSMSGCDMAPPADRHIIANHNGWRKRLSGISSDGLKPKSLGGLEILANPHAG
jgi:hypothetical protein